MKKLTALLMALALATTLFAACGSNDSTSEAAAESTASVVETASEDEAEKADDEEDESEDLAEEEPAIEEPAAEDENEGEDEAPVADAGDIDSALIGTWKMDAVEVSGQTMPVDDATLELLGMTIDDYTFTFNADGTANLTVLGVSADVAFALSGTTVTMTEGSETVLTMTFEGGALYLDEDVMGPGTRMRFAK